MTDQQIVALMAAIVYPAACEHYSERAEKIAVANAVHLWFLVAEKFAQREAQYADPRTSTTTPKATA